MPSGCGASHVSTEGVDTPGRARSAGRGDREVASSGAGRVAGGARDDPHAASSGAAGCAAGTADFDDTEAVASRAPAVMTSLVSKNAGLMSYFRNRLQ